ncbi:uncharacterized protein M421DRAFT_147115 [Didymella exigua CBS 183.55]|uniref:Uncharacterized protein n=1 Tax=Didymella exigua CBS 183.55 TaxID=1150837 RepID=A0A6A5RL32_9PLEO|nr:uncharacterized protein M421DRAFT_147115 [Didymella exigua CBS 183.55]KAF1929125.1 hypothetical protein M421DRAFT_147115 [Didymella exigua CBS 183.55]
MANSPTDSLGVNELPPPPKQQRSRSSGYVDTLAEQAEWDRYDRERQMKRYREGSRLNPTVHHRGRSDRLCVPIFETGKRPRSNERSEQQCNEFARNFKIEEVRPSPEPVCNYDLNTEPVLPSQLPTKYEWKPQQQSQGKPKIKVQIHQDTPTTFMVPSTCTPKRSPSASPNSPTAHPELQFQFSMLQAKLLQIETTCLPYRDIMPADPRDLTFEKIIDRVDGFAFDLHVWSQVANLDGLAMVEKSRRNVADAASRNLSRLIERVSDLHVACATAKPKDLKLPPLPAVGDDEGECGSYEDDDGDGELDDPTEAPGFVIHTLLHSIEVQIQTLKRLTRSLQEATPGAREEVISVARLVEETSQFFGSDTALKHHSIDPRFAGRKALDEARACAV